MFVTEIQMNKNNPNFWALIGFGVGAVIASAGTIVHPLDSLFGGLIQAAIWYGVARLILRKKSSRVYIPDSPIKHTFKFCRKCMLEVPEDKSWCANCGCVDFSFTTPEVKNCPMCSEEIKISAKKCRFCQEMLE